MGKYKWATNWFLVHDRYTRTGKWSFSIGENLRWEGLGYAGIHSYLKSETLASPFYENFDHGRRNDGRPQTTADLLTSTAPPQYLCRWGTWIHSQNPTIHSRSEKVEEKSASSLEQQWTPPIRNKILLFAALGHGVLINICWSPLITPTFTISLFSHSFTIAAASPPSPLFLPELITQVMN